ncbi:lysophosphatidic acid receptor 1-like isoform X2 [Eriocheir sinensis]|uniref:lysophosphatidic acid receptor 1-like isoform X2 n=1 Tax=Eriocheir sinensis TaxID=95602 RepID=UPI0021C93602|nr:lysophosphatidic acid receptor 1-like isoform X2 [Eriocheir sinensis]
MAAWNTSTTPLPALLLGVTGSSWGATVPGDCVEASPGENNNTCFPQDEDDFQPEDMSSTIAIIVPVIILLCVASGLVSSAVVCACPWIKRPMSPIVRLSLSLAAANTVFSASLSIAILVNTYLPTVHGVRVGLCVSLSLEAVRMGSILVQILHLLAVALTHYMGTVRPLHYASTMTPYALKLILAVLWLVPMAGMFIAFACVPGQGFQSPACSENYFYIKGITFRIIWALLFFGPMVLISMVYCRIFHLLNHRALSLVNAEQRNQLKRNIKTVKTTTLIVGSFVMGWGPAMVKFLLVCDECPIKTTSIDLTTNFALGVIVNTIYCLKVFTDTFIYAVQLRDVRKALQAMGRRLIGQVTGRQVDGPSRTVSRMSRTSSTRVFIGSPALRRTGSLPPPSSSAPCNSSSWPVNLEVSVYTNNYHKDDVRLTTLVEETNLDPIQEDDRL